MQRSVVWWADNCQKLLINCLVPKSDHPLCSERSYLNNYFFPAKSLPTHWKVTPRASWIFQALRCGEVGTAPAIYHHLQSTHNSQDALSTTQLLQPHKNENQRTGKEHGKFFSPQWTPLELDILAPISNCPVYLLAIKHTYSLCWRNAAQLAHQALVEWLMQLSCLSLLCLRGVLGLSQLASSSPGLWRLQPWVWSLSLKSCLFAIKQSMKLWVETQNHTPPAINPAQWVVYYRLCKKLFFRLKKSLSIFQQQRLHISEGLFVY